MQNPSTERKDVAGLVSPISKTHPELLVHPDSPYTSDEVSYGSAKYLLWQCVEVANHTWYAKVNNRVRSGCPLCSGKTLVSGINDLQTLYPDLAAEVSPNSKIRPSEVSPKSGKILTWRCSKGHEWDISPHVRQKGNGCPVCANKSARSGVNDLESFLNSNGSTTRVHPDSPVKPSEVTRGSAVPVLWQCSVNEAHSWTALPYNVVGNGSGCPRCVRVSEPEEAIATTISNRLGESNVLRRDRTFLGGKELDIYIPSASFAIEFNGLYWHSESRLGKDYHAEKTRLCVEKGVQLVHVWEDDWRDRREVVEAGILRKLGISREPKVYARKCKVTEISKSVAWDFLNANHIQGRCSGSYYLGLKTKDTNELVAVMAITRTKDVGRLDRYATSCIVPGGHSKMVKWVLTNLPITKMETFADLAVSTGDLYIKTGWQEVSRIPPDYRYIYKGQRIHKFNFRLKRFREDPEMIYYEGMTERQLAEMNGLERVWDCGKIKYEITKDRI